MGIGLSLGCLLCPNFLYTKKSIGVNLVCPPDFGRTKKIMGANSFFDMYQKGSPPDSRKFT